MWSETKKPGRIPGLGFVFSLCLVVWYAVEVTVLYLCGLAVV